MLTAKGRPKVVARSNVDPALKKCRIVPGTGGFNLLLDGEIIASCTEARKLSDWALDRNALEVRYDYNLVVFPEP